MNKQNSNNVLLAIETATFEVGAALVIDGEVVGELSQPAENRHAEELFVLIEQLLITAGIRLGDVGAFAVDIGPGLFTGLRVGVAAANALAYALSRPVIGISGTTSGYQQTKCLGCTQKDRVCGFIACNLINK